MAGARGGVRLNWCSGQSPVLALEQLGWLSTASCHTRVRAWLIRNRDDGCMHGGGGGESSLVVVNRGEKHPAHDVTVAYEDHQRAAQVMIALTMHGPCI